LYIEKKKKQVKNKKYEKNMKNNEKVVDKSKKDGKIEIEVILGDISYPKSEALIIPSNTKGVMSKGIALRIAKAGLGSISKSAKEYTKKNKVAIEECFTTSPGRLNRRGLKKIYHSAIKRLQSDFTSIHIVRNALDNVFQKVVKDKVQSVALCGFGIRDDCLDKKTVAIITVEVCKRYKNKVKIKIIDDSFEFIEEVKNNLK
jgi:O-acetyl-ADP-ribose deacetylase (regulator of RNase III)